MIPIKFNPEAISIALFNQLQTANGTGTNQFQFNTTDRRGKLPQDVPPANQPYLGLVEEGLSQVENQAQGLEKWLLHYRVLVYIRVETVPEAIPATNMNAALVAIVNAMRSIPFGNRQTLGGLVDHAWIDGDIIVDTAALDQQSAMSIPIKVDLGF